MVQLWIRSLGVYMKFSHLLMIFISMLVISKSVFAQSYIQVRSEESRWITEHITIAPDGWPEVPARQSYPTQQEALEQQSIWAKEFGSNLSLLRQAKPLSSGVIWTTRHAWSQDWEQKYAQWIEQEVDESFFVRYNFATDCADAVYALRWIFARIHGLPAASTLGGNSMLMTNETSRKQWANLPTATEWHKDRRFIAALNYLMNLTYTHTLMGDGYPVALSRKALSSGSFHLDLRDQTGHAALIYWLGPEAGAPFLTYNSTVPRKVRSLFSSLLFAEPSKKGNSALLRFRWPIKGASGIYLLAAARMPDFSQEQFSFKPAEGEDFIWALFNKLGVTATKEDLANWILKDIYEQFKLRRQIVQEGYQKCQVINCAPGSQGWEDWSTPSRDARIKAKIYSLETIGGRSPASAWWQSEVIQAEGVSWTLKAMIWNWKHAVPSHDPRASELARWGAGKQTWVQSQFAYLQEQLQARAQHRKSIEGKCTPVTCGLGSKGWEKYSSDPIDRLILERVNYLKRAGGHLPPEALDHLNANKMEVLFKHKNYVWTLQDFLKTAVTLNSAPFADDEVAWGQSKSLVAFELIGSPIVVDERWLSTMGSDQVFDSKSNESVTLPSPLVAVSVDSSWVLLQDSNYLRVYDLDQQQVTGAKFKVEAHLEVVYFNLPHLALFDGTETKVYHLNENHAWQEQKSLPCKWQAVATSFFSQEQKEPFLTAGSQIYSLVFQTQWSASSDIKGVFVSESDQYQFITFGPDQAGFAMEKLTGIVHNLALKGVVLGVTKDSRQILFATPGRPTLYNLNSNLEFSGAQVVGSFCAPQGQMMFACYQPSGSAKFFEIVDNQISLIPSPDGAYGLSNDIWQVYKNGARLIHRFTGQVLFSTDLWLIYLGHNLVATPPSREFSTAHLLNLNQSTEAPLLTSVMGGQQRGDPSSWLYEARPLIKGEGFVLRGVHHMVYLKYAHSREMIESSR